MDKIQTLNFIKGQLSSGNISREDLEAVLGVGGSNSVVLESPAGSTATLPERHESSRNLINIFYGIGAIIALVGVVILVEQNWSEIGFIGRILVTLGISFIAYVAGFLLNKSHQRMLSQVMFTISAALAPIGSYVLLNEAGLGFVWPYHFYTALALAVIFGYSLWATRKSILLLITIGFASWAYFTALLNIIGFSFYSDILRWAAMMLGFSYILVTYSYRTIQAPEDASDEKEKRAVANVLYGIGTWTVLGVGLSFGGIFDLLFIALVFAAFYGSVYLKSRSMLVWAAMFLMAYIIKITSKYFVGSIGWPVALIIVGFLVIGVGYLAYGLNKKYLSNK